MCLTGCKNDPVSPGGGPEPPILPAFFSSPAWHPDGEWIAVEHADSLDIDRDGKRDRLFGGIWLVHAETGETQHLISGFELPAWSPDGRKLAIVRNAQIHTIEVSSLEPARVDTSSLRQLTTEDQNYYPTWRPDGRWIAFDSNSASPNGMYFIWKMKFDGSEKTRIAYEPQQGEIRMPNWSPDGRHIVHQRYVGVGGAEVVVMDTSGENFLRLTFDDHHDNTRPRGQRLHFIPNRAWDLQASG